MLQHVSQVIDADLSGSKGSLPNLFLPYGLSKRQNFESLASASFIETNGIGVVLQASCLPRSAMFMDECYAVMHMAVSIHRPTRKIDPNTVLVLGTPQRYL